MSTETCCPSLKVWPFSLTLTEGGKGKLFLPLVVQRSGEWESGVRLLERSETQRVLAWLLTKAEGSRMQRFAEPEPARLHPMATSSSELF